MSYPLALSSFWSLLPIARCTLAPRAQVETVGLGGGDVLTASLGPSLWEGEVTLTRLYHAQAAPILALLDELQQPGASFLAHDPATLGPAADPAGATLGAATPQLNTVTVSQNLVSVKGLPAGYVLTPGDLIGWTYSSSPTRYGLHRVRGGANVVADGSGVTPTFKVWPPVRTGAQANNAVALVKPPLKAVVLPGSVSPGEAAGVFTTGIRFGFRQTLR